MDKSREFLREFIKLYENEPCLWQVNSKYYFDKKKKDEAYSKLVEKMKEFDPSSTKDSVTKKINTLRTSFRKELRKVEESLKSETSSDTVYKPKLWYFSMMSFLYDQDTHQSSNMDKDNDSAEDENVRETDRQNGEEMPQERSSQKKQLVSGKRSTSHVHFSHKQTDPEKSELDLANELFRRNHNAEDLFDLIGKTCAIKLRSLPKQQMLLAERLINDILCQAEMGRLTSSHCLAPEDNQHDLSTNCSPSPRQGSNGLGTIIKQESKEEETFSCDGGMEEHQYICEMPVSAEIKEEPDIDLDPLSSSSDMDLSSIIKEEPEMDLDPDSSAKSESE